MCGVVAVISPETSVSERDLWPALEVIRHRGPDGAGVWVASDGRVALGHVRLAIVDLQTGTQPIANEDGSLHVVVNGELYDFARIRRGLAARGHVFRTRSDSEIALHLYEEQGDGFVDTLRGEFALALWDARRRRLVAVRDRFGIKPLVWAEREGRVLLASEAKALFALGVEPQWDETSFLHAVSHQYLPPSRSLFAGVHTLPPAHLLVVEDGDVKVRPYWDLDFPIAGAESSADIRELGERLLALLDESVRLRLRADVPIGFYLSGGLDSASIVALAARITSAPVRCFGVRFHNAGYDESAHAADVAAHVGAVFEPVDVSQEAIVEALPEAVYSSEGLAINGQLTAKFLLSRAVQRAGLKVVLTGEGSDEGFFGYPHLVRDALRDSDETGAAGWLARLEVESRASAGVMMPDADPPPLASVREALGFVPSWLEAKALLGGRIVSLLGDAAQQRLADWDGFAALLGEFDVPGQLRGRPRVAQSAYLWTRLALAGYILHTLGDGTEMASSVEGRTPFLDHRLFELARVIPPSMKVHQGMEKHLLREVVRPLLPERVVRRRKHPFLAPPVTRFSSPRLEALVQDVLRSHSFAAVPFFEQARVVALLERLPALGGRARAAAEPALMTALCAAVLQERFRPADPA
jgi:asparagine synthase (glutamine-hydrolysing)